MACGDPGSAKCAWTASIAGVTARSESLSLFWSSEDLFGLSFSIALPVQALRGLHCLGSFSVVPHIRHIDGHPLAGVLLWSSARQAFDAPASVVQLPMLACGGREAMVMAPPPTLTQQYRLASMAAWFSSTGISRHDLLPHISSICLATVNSSPRPGIAPQSLNSSSQLLPLPGDPHPCPAYVWLQ